MSRQQKYNADYFPHGNALRNDRRSKALRGKYNLEGYAIFIMLLEILTAANHFQIENNDMELELIAGDIDIDARKLGAIITYLVKLGLLENENNKISSPTLNHLKNVLFELRKKDRKRKTENPTKEKETKENGVFQAESGFFQLESTQSKVKGRKVNKRKSLKEKGKKENSPVLKNNFLEEEKNGSGEKNFSEKPEKENGEKTREEKSSAKKEIFITKSLDQCRAVFLVSAPYYFWELRDTQHLERLLQKIMVTKPGIQSEEELRISFANFLAKLPRYWRRKKFTVTHLNENYNEILSEMLVPNPQSVLQKPVILRLEKPIPLPENHKKEQMNITAKQEAEIMLSDQEKEQRRKGFLRSICEAFENFVQSGETGFLPLWAMFGTLESEGHLKLSVRQRREFMQRAIAKRQQELLTPKNRDEAERFSGMLANFDKEIEKAEEKERLQTYLKSFAVEDYFEKMKAKKADLKILFEL